MSDARTNVRVQVSQHEEEHLKVNVRHYLVVDESALSIADTANFIVVVWPPGQVHLQIVSYEEML
jgi:hypothetical protein